MRTFIFYLFVMLFSSCKPLELGGIVKNYEGQPISGATIINKRSGQLVTETRSDKMGHFILNSLQVDDSIIISAPGFKAEMFVYDYNFLRRPELSFWLRRND